MDRFYISYIDDKNTEYYCVEEVSALKATERFFDFCDKNNIDPKSFRITGMIKGPDEQLAASEAAGADELEDAEREKPASGNTQQVLEELRQRAINAIKNSRHEDIKNAETREEIEERAKEYCESLMQYAEQDKASYFFRAERNLLILLTLFSSVEKDEDEEVSNSIVYLFWRENPHFLSDGMNRPSY